MTKIRNRPRRRKFKKISFNSNQRLLPIGVIIQWSGVIQDIPRGFVLCDGNNSTPDLRDRFVIGAGNLYNVNATGGSATHIHTVGGGAGGSLNAGTAIINSAPAGSWTPGFSISISMNSPAKNHLPNFYSLCYIMTTTIGAIPNNAIVLWSGSVDSIPEGYQLCNGSNGTDDLKDCFIIGAGTSYNPKDTGGADAHSHSFAFGGVGGALSAGNIILNSGTGGADHTCIYSGTCSLASVDSRPPYYALAYIQNISGASQNSYAGFITIWSGAIVNIPSGWTLNNALKDKFIVGAGGSYAVGNTGGATTHTQFPGYTGTFGLLTHPSAEIIIAGGGSYDTSGTFSGSGPPSTAANMPPYYALAYIIKS
jgi:hypothetical protein